MAKSLCVSDGEIEVVDAYPEGDAPNDTKRLTIITKLAELPEKTFLDESALADIFGITPRTIRRMVVRYEIPPPIPVAGKSVWFAGRILAYMESAAEKAEMEVQAAAAKIKRMRS